MPGSQGSGPGSVGVSAVSRQSRTAAMSPAVRRSRPAGGCQQVAERVLSSFGRQGEQVGSQGRPGGFGGESGDVLVGLVELCDGLGSDELFGCDVEAVGVALDRLEKPGGWVAQLAAARCWRRRALHRGRGSAAASRSACAVRWCRVG